MYTLEEMEAKIIERLTDGKGQALDEYACTCKYRRRGDNLPCVVGALVPDEHYNALMEGPTIRALHPSLNNGKWFGDYDDDFQNALAAALNASGVPATEASWRMLSAWQRRHDDAHNWNGNEYVGELTTCIESE